MADTRGIRAGRAFVELGVSDKLTAGLKRAQQQLQTFGAGLRSIGTRWTALGAGVLTPLAASARTFVNVGDSLHKMSARTGVSVESLSELALAADLAGTDLETLEVGLRRMQKTITEAAGGSKTATDALAQLALTVQDLVDRSPEQQFKRIADRIGQIEDPTRRAALAMELFGRSGTRLLPLIQNGAQGLEAVQEQARALGLTISTQTAQDAALLKDTLSMLWRVLRQMVFTVGSALAPLLTELAAAVTQTVVAITRWIGRNKAVIVTIAKAAAAVTAAGAALIAIGTAISGVGSVLGVLVKLAGLAGGALGAMGALLGALVSPVGLALAAVSGLGAVLVTSTQAGGRALAWLRDQFGSLSDTVSATLAGMVDALTAGDLSLAARVLWAGLRAAWETGIAPLQQLWEAFRFKLESVAIDAFAAMKRAWIEVRDWFETNFPNFTAFIAKTWANLTAGLRNVWARFQNWLSDLWLELLGLLDSSLDVEAAKKLGRQDLEAQLSGIEGQREADVAEAERRRQRSPEQREAEKQAALAELEQARQQAHAAAEAAHRDRLAAAQEELAAAQEELRRRRAHAAQRRAEGDGPPLPAADLRDQLEGVGETMTRKFSVVGTFNVAGIQGLGGPDKRLVKAADETARNTKRLLDAARAGQLVFARG